MKNILIYFFIVIMLVSFVSCSNFDISNENSEKNENDEIMHDEEVLSFCFGVYGDVSYYENTKEKLAPVLKELEKMAEHLNIILDFNWIKYDEVITKLQANDDIDAVSFVDFFEDPFVTEGLIMDITDKFEAYAPGYLQQLSEETLDNISVNGRIYCIPNLNPDISNRNCVLIRKNLFLQSGLDNITTYEEYGEFLKWVKENKPDMTPGVYYFVANGQALIRPYLNANGYYSDSYDIFYKWDDIDIQAYTIDELEPFMNLYNLLKEWNEQEYLKLDILKPAEWANCASTIVNIDSMRVFINMAGSEYEYDFFPLYLNSKVESTKAYDYVTMINAKSPDADRVIMFFEYLFSDKEAYSLLMYGINGTNYTQKNSKIYIKDGMESILNWRGSSAFKNYLLEKPMIFEPDNYAEMIKKCFSYNAEKTPFDKLYESMDEEDGTKMKTFRDNLKTYRKAVENIFDSIAKNDFSKDLDIYFDEIQSAGALTVQKEYNEWLEDVSDK